VYPPDNCQPGVLKNIIRQFAVVQQPVYEVTQRPLVALDQFRKSILIADLAAKK